jgi:hypothetical protein
VLEAIERRVEGALLDLQGAARELLDTEQDAVAMHVAERYGLHDEQVEGAGEEVG